MDLKLRTAQNFFTHWFLDITQNIRWIVLICLVLTAVMTAFLLIEPLMIKEALPDILVDKGRQPPNIIMIVSDALSAEYMSLFGYPLPTTPGLESLAEGWNVYQNTQSPTTCSVGILPSIMTGRYPYSNHFHTYGEWTRARDGWVNLGNVLQEAGYQVWWEGYMSPGFYQFGEALEYNMCAPGSLEELLARSRFTFRGIIASRATRPVYLPWLLRKFVDIRNVGINACGDVEMLADLLKKWSDTGQLKPPFFLYLHEGGVHGLPYPPGNNLGKFLPIEEGMTDGDSQWSVYSTYDKEDQSLVDKLGLRYSEAVLSHDARIVDFIDQLKESGIYDSSLVVLTADHGQNFNNGYTTHCTPLVSYSETHVPLLIKFPGQKQGKKLDFMTSTIDLAPTILDVAGISYPQDWFDGQSLLALEKQPDPNRIVLSRRIELTPYIVPFYVAADSQYRLVLRTKDGKELLNLYDYRNDPKEQYDLYPSMKEDARVLRLARAIQTMRQRSDLVQEGKGLP